MAQDRTKDDGGVSKKVADAKKALGGCEKQVSENWRHLRKSGRGCNNYIGDPPKMPVSVTPVAVKAPSSGFVLGEAESAGEGIKERAEQLKDIPKDARWREGEEERAKEFEER